MLHRTKLDFRELRIGNCPKSPGCPYNLALRAIEMGSSGRLAFVYWPKLQSKPCSAPWRAENTLRICPTTNGAASVRIFPRLQDGDVLGFTAYGRSSTPSSMCSRAAAPGGFCPETSPLGRPSTTGSGDGASTGRGSV